MNKTRSFITDMSEYFVTGFEKLTLCSNGGIRFLYIIQNYSKQVSVHRGACSSQQIPPNMARYIYEIKISKGLLEPLNCIPYSFIYSRYT